MGEAKICEGCGKEPPAHLNYCTWECHIAHARKLGGREHLPNGLPIRCLTRDGMMLECEHGDHPDYKFPVEAGRDRYVDRRDEESSNDTHAVIYVDGAVALTLSECNYSLWSLRDGRFLSGPAWNVGKRLSFESMQKLLSAVPRRSEADR